MSAISLKSITGITSITTPSGVDDQLTLHNNNTTEAVKLDIAGNVHVNNQLAVAGVSTFSEGVIIPDNKALSLGNRLVGSTAGDLRLYHDTNNSYIDEIGSGNLYIRNNTNNSIVCQTNGFVRLYNNGNEKLATTSSGVSVTGNVVATGADINGDLDVDGHTNLDNVNIVGVTTTNGNLNVNGVSYLYGSGGAAVVWGNTGYSGHLSFDGSNNAVIRAASGKALIFQTNHVNERLRITDDGDIYTSNDQVRDNARLTVTNNAVGVSTSIYLHNANGSGTATKISASKSIILSADVEANSGTSSSFISFETDATEKVRITSAGNVGINEVSPAAPLHVENNNANASTYYLNTDAIILVQNKNSSASAKTVIKLEGPAGSGDCALVYGSGSTNMIFADRQNERLRIDSSGRLLAGTSNPINSSTSKFQVAANDATGSAVLARFSASSYSSYLDFYKSRNATLGSETVVNNNDHLGALRFYGCDGNGYYTAAEIYGTCDGGASDNDMPGRLTFHTRPDGNSSNMTERLRIHSTGQIRIGGSISASPQCDLDVVRANSTLTDVMLIKGNAGNGFIRFQDNDNSCNFTVGADDGAGLGANSFILYDRVNSAYRFGVDNSGNFKVNSGNLVIGTSGKGIDFSATGQASGMSNELLDDYEEGSFTLTASPSSGTMTFNSSYNQGTYTKMGNVVHIQAYLSISGNSGSGTLELNSLPFTVKDSTDASGHVRAFSIVYLNNNSPVDGSGYYLAQVYANEGNTWIRIYQVNSLGRRSGDIANKFGGGGDIFLQFTYFAS